MLTHIVAYKFKAEVTEERIKHFFEKEADFKTRMPDLVENWSWGKNVTLVERAAVNHGCNYLFVMTLKDEAALKAYQVHPEHIKVKEIQAPLVDAVVVFDLDA